MGKIQPLRPSQETSLSRESNKMLRSIASSALSIDEIRILARIVQALRPDQKMVTVSQFQRTLFKDFVLTFNYKDLVPKDHKNYTGLMKALDSLRKRSANTFTERFETVDGWITKARHDKSKGKVSIVIGEELIPDYLALGEGYTEYITNVIFKLNSKHVINIYKKKKKNKDREYFNLYIPYLKEFLGIPADQYTHVRDFRNRVLVPAEKELKEKADIYFEAEYRKKAQHDGKEIGVLKDGRQITGYRIRIINRSYKVEKQKEREEENIKLFHDKFVEKIGLRNPLFYPTLRNWCKKYGAEPVMDKLNSIAGYVKKAQASKKINYMQRAIYQEFEKKEGDSV